MDVHRPPRTIHSISPSLSPQAAVGGAIQRAPSEDHRWSSRLEFPWKGDLRSPTHSAIPATVARRVARLHPAASHAVPRRLPVLLVLLPLDRSASRSLIAISSTFPTLDTASRGLRRALPPAVKALGLPASCAVRGGVDEDGDAVEDLHPDRREDDSRRGDVDADWDRTDDRLGGPPGTRWGANC